jgi:hypothetical protein
MAQMTYRGDAKNVRGNTTMASGNHNSSRGRNAKTGNQGRMDKKQIAPRNLEKEKNAGKTPSKTIEEFTLELESKWEIYHDLELKQKDENLRWFYDGSEDFRLVCELADLNDSTVKRLFEESLLAGNLEPIKRIYNF